jgi:hypothetical protein
MEVGYWIAVVAFIVSIAVIATVTSFAPDALMKTCIREKMEWIDGNCTLPKSAVDKIRNDW